MRRVPFNLHLYGALIVRLFVVLVGVTASLMVFEEGLDRLFHPKLYKVQPQGQRISAGGLLAAAARVYPGQRSNSIRLPGDETDSAGFGARHEGAFQVGSPEPESFLPGRPALHTGDLFGIDKHFMRVSGLMLITQGSPAITCDLRRSAPAT